MSILTKEEKKEVAKHVYKYFEYKREIAEYREKVLHGSKPMYGEIGGGYSYHSDNTAIKAIKLADPPKNIQEKIKWVEAIEKAINRFKNTDKGKILQMKYFDEEGDYYIMQKLDMKKSKYYYLKDEILDYIGSLMNF